MDYGGYCRALQGWERDVGVVREESWHRALWQNPAVYFLGLFMWSIRRIFVYMNQGILTTVIREINALHNIHCRLEKRPLLHRGIGVDAQIHLSIGREEILLNAEVKSKIVPAQIPQIIALNEEIDSLILIARYITPRAKEMLIREQIPYADTAGNIFLNKKAIYLFVENKKPHLDKIESKGRAFTTAGLKVVYQFLIHPEYINHTYRFIGERAGVSIRTVGKTLEGLVHEKYVLKENSNNYLYTDREKLLQRWVTAYHEKLKPKLNRRRFRWRNKTIRWQNLKMSAHTAWGGPAAAELLTPHLIADKWTVYTGLDIAEIIEKFELIPDKKGEVEVVQKFWDEPNGAVKDEWQNIVHPILVYADLIEDSNLRYIETAKIIYDEYVKNHL